MCQEGAKMRRFILIFIMLSFFLTSCTSTNITEPKQEKNNIESSAERVKAVWTNYNELSMKSEADKSENKKIRKPMLPMRHGFSDFCSF